MNYTSGLHFFPLGHSKKIVMVACAICETTQHVRLQHYVDGGYHGECDGCGQHVRMPVEASTVGEACAAWNLLQTRLTNLMKSLPDGVTTCS